MLLSHDPSYLFVKTRKTAGTSVELSLSRYMKHKEDIITVVSDEDEVTRWRFGGGPRNWEDPETGKTRFYNHMPLSEIKEHLWLKEVFSWTIERNPWDKCVSMYFYSTDRKRYSFERWMQQDDTFIPTDWDRYTNEYGAVAVDKILLYDDLDAELKSLCDQLGIPWDGWLPKAKSRFRKVDPRHYSAFFTAKSRARVEEIFAKELEHFGWKYEDRA